MNRLASCFGAIGFGGSPKQAAVAIIDDQNATHSKAGMTISPVWIGQSNRRWNNVYAALQFRKHGGVRVT
jgi:hypothetical protein